VLCTVLQQPLFPVLRGLGMLVGVFKWHSLVINQFSGRITRSDAGKLKVGAFIEAQPPTERKIWKRAFEEFKQAWHIAWPYIERHECLELTENLKKVMITEESDMIWCIADSANEGICPLALTQWLVTRHNELVQVVSATAHRANKNDARGQRGARSMAPVSSRLLGQHDVINYDEKELMRFLRSRCVTYGVGGKLNFDFKQLEQQLKRELAKPEITMELRGFHWLGEELATSHELKSIIRQKDLPPDVAERMRAELSSPSVANDCLQKVQMSISFILKSGGGLSGEHAGEMHLIEYLRTVLSEGEDCIPSATARAEVRLSQVDSFVKLLKQLVNKDPMDGIDPKYCADLPEELERQLVAVLPGLPKEILISVLATFAETRLTEAWIGEEVKLFEILESVEDLQDEPEAFNDVKQRLPGGVLMKHWAAVYKLLKAH